MLGPLLEVKMMKSACRSGVKHVSNQNVQNTSMSDALGSGDVERVHGVVARSTSTHFWTFKGWQGWNV